MAGAPPPDQDQRFDSTDEDIFTDEELQLLLRRRLHPVRPPVPFAQILQQNFPRRTEVESLEWAIARAFPTGEQHVYSPHTVSYNTYRMPS